jgi:DNA-binding NtrC family response regulator
VVANRQVLKQLATRFGIVGESEVMTNVMSRLIQVAPTDLTVLLTGETGTGKEVFAHALHDLSQRKKQAFVSVNCGAIPETLLESELFGAEKGAYTGAEQQRKGFFESANNGTIFLDEIGEMPVGTQVKLLRILESGEFSRLGSSDNLKVDVRVVAATNRDLQYEVRQGRFRQDLYFRLNSVSIPLPPLRKHPDDIPILVEHFAQKVCDARSITFRGVDPDAMAMLMSHPWHGNVRELRNVIETMVTLEQGARITTEMLGRYLAPYEEGGEAEMTQALVRIGDGHAQPRDADLQMIYRTLLQLAADVNEVKSVLRHLLSLSFEAQQVDPHSGVIVTPPPSSSDRSIRDESIREEVIEEELKLAHIERMAIQMALRRTQGNRREAADILGISERTLYRKIDEYDLK